MDVKLKKFLKKVILFLFPPLVILVTLYGVFDPFFLFKEPLKKPGRFIQNNRGHFNARLLLKNNREHNINYNSFILASSRGLVFDIEDWGKATGQKSFSGFHFEDNRESIFGMYKKAVFLDKHGFDLKNVLVLIDREVLEFTEEKSGMYERVSPFYNRKVYQIFLFYLDHAKVYFDPRFFIPYFVSKLTTKNYEFMEGVIDPNYPGLNHINNQVNFKRTEKYLKPKFYYTNELINSIVSKRVKRLDKKGVLIDDKQKYFLGEMSNIFKKHNTLVKVVINPLADQIPFDQKSLDYLHKLFGMGSVFDFSGKNEITSNYLNYYEETHYRPHVAKKILDDVYRLNIRD